MSHQSLSAVGDSEDASPNMIGEQILELRDGLNSFQANAFESLYDKKVSWVKDSESATVSIPVSKESVVEVISDSEDKITVPDAAKIPADIIADEAPVVTEAKSTLIVKPIAVVDKGVNKDVIAVRNIPVRPPPEESEELAAENRKRAIIKAQQAVTQSFLSLDSFASEPEPESAPAVTSTMEPAVVFGKNSKPESAVGGFFSFLKSDNAVQNIANLKPTAPPSVAKAFMAPVAAVTKITENVDSDEKRAAMMSRPSISDLKTGLSPRVATAETDEAPAGGFFGFLKQPTASSENVIVKLTPKAVVAKVEPIVVKEVEEMKKTPSSGFFSFLNSDPNIAVPISKPSTSNIVKALSAVPEETYAPVTNSPAKPTTVTPPAGLFGFLKSTPVPEVVPAKKAPVVVTAQIPSPAPVLTPKLTVSVPQPGGFFGFLNPSPGSSKTKTVVPSEEIIAPATAKKISVNIPAVKESRPVAAAPVVKVSSAIPESGGLFGFLSPKGGESKKIEPSIKEFTAPVVKATTSKVAVPDKSVESKAVAMNVKFQTSVSKLLKGDGNKIKTFQRATDDFRSDDVSSENFIETLITLFGADALESVIIPLISELPERKMSVKLQIAYDKKVTAMRKAENPAKSPFSFNFGGAPKKTVSTPTPTAALVAVLPVASINEKKFMSGGPKARVPVTAISVKEAVFKVPSKVPIAKKLSIEKQMKSLLSGSTDVKTFYSNVSKELGKEKTKEVMPDIIAVFPADIRTKIEAIFRADK